MSNASSTHSGRSNSDQAAGWRAAAWVSACHDAWRDCLAATLRSRVKLDAEAPSRCDCHSRRLTARPETRRSPASERLRYQSESFQLESLAQSRRVERRVHFHVVVEIHIDVARLPRRASPYTDLLRPHLELGVGIAARVQHP